MLCKLLQGLSLLTKHMCVFVGVMLQDSEICLSYPNSSVTLQDRPEFEHPLLVSSEKYDCLFLNEEAQVLFHHIKMKPKPPLAQSKVHKPIPSGSEVKVSVKHLK